MEAPATIKIHDERKSTGSHFTPSELAQFVAQRILHFQETEDDNSVIRVLDPACGDGELLLAYLEHVPSALLKRLHIIGIDQNASALQEATERLSHFSVHRQELIHGDFLDICIEDAKEPSLFEPTEQLPPVHAIIANPPYVRTQVMGAEKSQILADQFSLSGRVDLYQAFLVCMTQKLLPGGIIGVITSNRFLSIKSGETTRQLLDSSFEINELYDLGDTKLFEAAVLPAVLVGTRLDKKPSKYKATFVKIYECDGDSDTIASGASSIFRILSSPHNGAFVVADKRYKVSTGSLCIPDSYTEPWKLISDDETEWVRKIDENTHHRFGDLVKVRVGIKTTADNVFIKNDWGNIDPTIHPEQELLRPLLTRNSASKWATGKVDHQVLYTHYSEGNKRQVIDLTQYPKAKAYLESHRPQLEGREYVIKSGRNWFEIWVPQRPEMWQKPKLVFPDISPEPRFFYNDSGAVVNGNCYWLTVDAPHDHNLLFLLQGLANSSLMTRYHDLVFNNKLYSGRRRYLTQYVSKYPVPDMSSDAAHRIIEITRSLVLDGYDPKLEEELEAAVADAFEISDFAPSQPDHLIEEIRG